MTKGKFDKLFKEWKERLGLHLWDFQVTFDIEEDDETSGSNLANFEYIQSIIKFNTKIFGRKSEHIEKTIIHELLHCYLGFYNRNIESLNIKPDIYDAFIAGIVDKEEIVCSTLTNILYNLKYKTK